MYSRYRQDVLKIQAGCTQDTGAGCTQDTGAGCTQDTGRMYSRYRCRMYSRYRQDVLKIQAGCTPLFLVLPAGVIIYAKSSKTVLNGFENKMLSGLLKYLKLLENNI